MAHQIELLKKQNKDLIYLNSILERNNLLQKEEIAYLKKCLGIEINGNNQRDHLTVE